MNYYILVVFFQCCGLYLSINASTIVVSPQDTEAIVGGNTTLYCTVDGLGSNTVVWRKYQSQTIIYSRNRTIAASSRYEPDRYEVTGNDTEGTFNLQITGIILEVDDTVNYQCIIIDNNAVFLNGSGPAELRVYDKPDSPTCTVTNDEFLEGDNVYFECTFVSIIPKVEVNLTRNYNILPNAIVDQNLNAATIISSTSLIVTADDDGAMLRCSVDHQVFNMPYECSITLNVKHKPIVEITQMGRLSDGNASFTCGAVSNPDATEFKWSVCLGDTDECIDPGDGILTVEQDDSDGLATECEVFGYNVSCQMFKNGETELPVYVVLKDDNLTIPENMTVTECLLKCSIINTIGEGNDNFTIDNAICVMAIEPTTIMPTTPEPTTVIATTTDSLPTSISDSTENIGTNIIPTVATNSDDNKTNSGDEFKEYYFIIGVLAGGTVFLFLITIIILICKNAKTEPDEDNVSPTQWTHYANTGYDENGGFGETDNVMYTADNPFKSFGKDNKIERQSSRNDSETIHDTDTLPMHGDNTRHEPEGEVGNDVYATSDGQGDSGGGGGGGDGSDGGEGGVGEDGAGDAGDQVAINMAEPQYAVVNRTAFGHDRSSPDALETVDGVEYNIDDSNPCSEINHNTRSATQI